MNARADILAPVAVVNGGLRIEDEFAPHFRTEPGKYPTYVFRPEEGVDRAVFITPTLNSGFVVESTDFKLGSGNSVLVSAKELPALIVDVKVQALFSEVPLASIVEVEGSTPLSLRTSAESLRSELGETEFDRGMSIDIPETSGLPSTLLNQRG